MMHGSWRLAWAAVLGAVLLMEGCAGPDYRPQAISDFQVGHLAEAKQLFSQALQRDPADPLAIYYLGRIAFQEGAYEDAIYHFQCCLDIDPGYADARAWLLRSQQAAGAAGKKLQFIPIPPARPPRPSAG